MLRRKRDLPRLFIAAAVVLLAVVGLFIPARANAAVSHDGKSMSGDLAEEVRHQLVMLPYYSVFDNLEFEVQDGGTVVLSGQVTRPTLKSDAENTVRRIQDVAEVVNHIEVLPLSNYDDRLRLALYRALFGNIQLDRYALGAIPSIHIIVKNGNATLIGIVASQTDRNVAEVFANGVSGVFSVANNLTVEKKG